MKIHLATGNAHKLREFQRLADAAARPGEARIEIVAPAAMPAVVEDSGTFTGNARKKAAALRAVLPPDAWVLADDSGLCVDALGGRPGVESAYFAGPAGDGAANLAKLVAVMRDIPAERRGAQFVCVLVLVGPDGVERVAEGRCDGALRFAPAGGHGFGYDPVFVPAGESRTYAELAEAEKNLISHRARAWQELWRKFPGDASAR